MRTLVIHLGAIGDFLLCCPTLSLLGARGPVEVLGRRDRVELAVAGGLAAAAHDIEETDFSSVFLRPGPRLRALLARFDRCVAWFRDTGSVADAIRSCGPREVHLFRGLPPEGWTRHASEYYSSCLGLPETPPLRLRFAAGRPALDVVIHPGSGSPDKNWPLERFRAVAAALERQGRAVTWCAGPAEDAWWPREAGLELRAPSLTALAEQLAGARLYLGNDSGITHLAAAAGCPTVAVFGPTDPAVWGPRGGNVAVVRGQPWPDVPEVMAAARGLIETPPATDNGEEP